MHALAGLPQRSNNRHGSSISKKAALHGVLGLMLTSVAGHYKQCLCTSDLLTTSTDMLVLCDIAIISSG